MLPRADERGAVAGFHTLFPFLHIEDFRSWMGMRARLHAGRKPGLEQTDAALRRCADRADGLPDRGAGNGEGRGIAEDMQPGDSMRLGSHGLAGLRRGDASIDVPIELPPWSLDIELGGQVAAGLSNVLAGRCGALAWHGSARRLGREKYDKEKRHASAPWWVYLPTARRW